MLRCTRLFAMALISASPLITACGSSGTDGATATQKPGAAPSTGDKPNPETGDEAAGPEANRPEWDYTGWVWYGDDATGFKLAAPADAGAMTLDSVASITGGGYASPSEIDHMSHIFLDDVTLASMWYAHLAAPAQSEADFERLEQSFLADVESKYGYQSTDSTESIGYVGDYARQYLFRSEYDFVASNGDGDHYIVCRLIIAGDRRYALMYSAEQPDYDPALANQIFDSFELTTNRD